MIPPGADEDRGTGAALAPGGLVSVEAGVMTGEPDAEEDGIVVSILGLRQLGAAFSDVVFSRGVGGAMASRNLVGAKMGESATAEGETDVTRRNAQAAERICRSFF